jgi:hypothetical protein
MPWDYKIKLFYCKDDSSFLNDYEFFLKQLVVLCSIWIIKDYFLFYWRNCWSVTKFEGFLNPVH